MLGTGASVTLSGTLSSPSLSHSSITGHIDPRRLAVLQEETVFCLIRDDAAGVRPFFHSQSHILGRPGEHGLSQPITSHSAGRWNEKVRHGVGPAYLTVSLASVGYIRRLRLPTTHKRTPAYGVFPFMGLAQCCKRLGATRKGCRLSPGVLRVQVSKVKAQGAVCSGSSLLRPCRTLYLTPECHILALHAAHHF